MVNAPKDSNCIFCRIVAGEIPCHRVYEDETLLAFLDINPLAPGHALVVPKAHFERLEAMPEAQAGACAAALPRLARAILPVVDAPGWNLLQNNGGIAGQEVGHVHFHIIPRREDDGLGYRWKPKKLDNDEAKRLLGAITPRV